jgi:hypothetical protein
MLASVRLEEKSLVSCAVSSWRDQLYLAWTGTDNHLNLASSADGRTITGKQRLAETSLYAIYIGWVATAPLSPALAVSGGRLWLAWQNGGSLYVRDAEQHGRPHRVASGAAAGSPSLTATGPDGLAVTYRTGTLRRRAHLLTMAEDTPGGPPRTVDKTPPDVAVSGAPAVCEHEGRLILAWRGTDRHIYLLTMTADRPGAPTRLEETHSYSAPALCSHQDRLALAWTGSKSHIYLLTMTADGPGAPMQLEARSSGLGTPALCSHQGRLILAWTGADSRIYLASVQ